MKSSVFLQSLAAVCIAATASAVSGQNAIQLFGPVNVRVSTQGTGYGANEYLQHHHSEPDLHRRRSRPRFRLPPTAPAMCWWTTLFRFSMAGGTPTDICRMAPWKTATNRTASPATMEIRPAPAPDGQDPDTFVTYRRRAAHRHQQPPHPGAVQAQIGLVDTGYLSYQFHALPGDQLLLEGVAGPGKVTGNPISAKQSDRQQLAQNYSFNSTTNQQVQFTYDLIRGAECRNSFDHGRDGAHCADTPLNPATFQSTYLNGTSFATANCLVHTGELFNGSPACKLYTLTCQVGTDPTQSGALCPTSQQRNEIFQDSFRRSQL